MLYNNDALPKYVRTAGKITVVTALSGLLVFLFAFVFDFGAQELSKVSAQNNAASTTLTVLNTPPSFDVNAYELVESSTSTPTNSGDIITWSAVGSDSNGAPYFLLICSANASPTANAAADSGSLGTAPPDCHPSTVQWGVSTSTVSGNQAFVSTSTTEVAPFAEIQEWYAWVCDDDPDNPRCVNPPVQGFSATNSSPFHVNRRPVLSDFLNNGSVDPSGTVVFNSTSTDPDSVGGEDEIYLIVCNSNTDYNTTTNTCANDFIASTTLTTILSDAAASYTVASIMRDDDYPAYGYLVDRHGHEALANPLQSDFTVNNVAPTVLGGDIVLNSGGNMSLTVPGDETTGFTLDFTIRDANSCLNAASSSEITSFGISVFRSSYGTSTALNVDACDGTAGQYDPNFCYPNGVGPTTWNLSCAATTTCASPLQDDIDYACTFPLWFLADPTDNGPNTPAVFEVDNWSAGVYGIDDDALSGPMATTTNGVELISFNSIGISDDQIAYGGIEPGFDSINLTATSTALNLGNTGLDQLVRGDSMCTTYSLISKCAWSATSTIPEFEQKFSSTSLSYGDVLAVTLASTSDSEVELDVKKTTSTSSPQEATTYWGISVPASITLAGSYKGLNTYTAKTAEPEDWI